MFGVLLRKRDWIRILVGFAPNQANHHNSYTQFGSIDKVKNKVDQEIKDSKKGIKQSKKNTQEELNNVKQRDKNNKLHLQNEQQKATKNLGDANQKHQKVSNEKINQEGPVLIAMNVYLTDEHSATKSVFEIGDKITISLTMDKVMRYQNGKEKYAANSKIIINGLEFSLSTNQGFAKSNASAIESTQLVFERTIQANDAFTQGKGFSIKSSADLIISGISDRKGYPPAFINTIYPVSLSNTIVTKFDNRNLTVVGDAFQGYTIEKQVGNASWDTDVFSQESFVGDGYAIFTLNSTAARKPLVWVILLPPPITNSVSSNDLEIFAGLLMLLRSILLPSVSLMPFKTISFLLLI
jgi:hypothetical protein